MKKIFIFLTVFCFFSFLVQADEWDFRVLFPYRAEISVNQAGWYSVSITPEMKQTLGEKFEHLHVYSGDDHEAQPLKMYVMNDAAFNNKDRFKAKIVDVFRKEVSVSLQMKENAIESGEKKYTEVYVIEFPKEALKQQDSHQDGVWKICFESKSSDFAKQVVVEEEKGGVVQPKYLEDSTIFRISDSKSEKTEVSLPAIEPRFKVTLTGDRGYLEPEIFLEKEKPASWKIHFFVSAVPASKKVFLYWGGNRFSQPQAISTAVRDEHEVATESVSIQENPLYQSKPFLEKVLKPGAVVDPSGFSHYVPFYLPASPEGMTQISLEPKHWALLKNDGHDLRIVDQQMQQWSYWLGDVGQVDGLYEEKKYPMTISSVKHENGKSIYTLENPYSGILVNRMKIVSADTFFNRSYELRKHSFERGTQVLGRGKITADDPDILVSFQEGTVELEMQNGSNQPLTLGEIEAIVLIPKIVLIAPEGRYQLLLGNAQAASPQYDLAKSPADFAPLVAAHFDLKDDAVSFLGKNQSVGVVNKTQQNWIFLMMGLAVIVLAILTLRVAKK